MTTRDLDSAMFQRGEAFALLTVIARWRRLGLAPADMLRRRHYRGYPQYRGVVGGQNRQYEDRNHRLKWPQPLNTFGAPNVING